MNELKKGKEVWWDDPDGKTSGIYVVDEINYDEDGALYDDTIVLISNGTSEAEVWAGELQDMELRRERIKELVGRITEIAEEDDWIVHNHNEKYNKIDLYFAKSSSRDQDFGFYINYASGDIDGFINAVEEYYESYDPSEEAALWIGEDGHGKNGAPYDLADILDDMNECKNNVKELIDLFYQELKGVKINKPTKASQLYQKLNQVRTEVIENIQTIFKDICEKLEVRSVLWSIITNQIDPDICYETDSDSCSVLPSTIELDDDDKSFIIIFASFEDCPNSINGENIYTETLIDILEYLENYRSTL